MGLFDSLKARLDRKRADEAAEPFAGSCLNCGTVRVGPHCHSCGQKAHIHRTTREWFHDLLHGALHFDGKTWRTLPMLAWRPGELTRRYVEGERARFVSPMALFLFSVFLMFAIFQLAGITPPTDISPSVQLDQPASAEDAPRELAELRDARARMSAANPAAALVDIRIAALERQLGEAPANPSTEELLASDRPTGVAFIDHALHKWRDNPGLMAYKLQSNGYKFSWLLIPLSLPFLWLLFAWKRRFGMYDHAVFVTYSLAFMTLFYVALVALSALGVAGDWLVAAALVVPICHIYRQLRGAYQLSRFSAVWRTVALIAAIGVVMFLFVDLLLVIGAVG